MGPMITLTKRLTGRKDFERALAAVRNTDVLVGIPQSTSSRRGSQINNAELLYIFSHGSPARNQPPRPVIEPAIMADGNRQPIAENLKEAAAAWMHRDPGKALMYLKRAGTVGRDAAKAWFTDSRNGWEQNAASTVRAKLAHLRGKKRSAAYAAIAAAGGDTTGIVVAGIDTGNMRRAIVYVVRERMKQTSVQQVEQANEREYEQPRLGSAASAGAPEASVGGVAEGAAESAAASIAEGAAKSL